MPFIKEYTDPDTHVVANYWAVTSLMYDVFKNVTNFVAGVFVDETAYTAGAQPVTTFIFNDNAGQLTVTQCEDIVKARPEFADSIAI